jgi:uncharacterized membrane protein
MASPPSGGKSVDPKVDRSHDQSEEPDQSTGRTTADLTLQSFEFSGPLPPPHILKVYNEAFPGCAERIVTMAEKQSQHRQELEKLIIIANAKAQSRGQIFAFVLSFMIICGGVYLLAEGKSIQGFSAIILALGSLIGALVFGRSAQRKERERKMATLPPAALQPSARSKSN